MPKLIKYAHLVLLSLNDFAIWLSLNILQKSSLISKQEQNKKCDIKIFNAHLISAAVTADDVKKDFNVPLSPYLLVALY